LGGTLLKGNQKKRWKNICPIGKTESSQKEKQGENFGAEG